MILNKGETLFLQEERGDLFCLKRGLLKVTRTRKNGEVLLFNLLVPGDIFPHHSLLSPQPNYGCAQALIESEIERIPAAEWYESLEQDPFRYKEVALHLQQTLRKLQQRVEMIVAPSHERIPLFREWLNRHCPGMNIEELLTQEEIGQFLGLSRETVNRYLRRERAGK